MVTGGWPVRSPAIVIPLGRIGGRSRGTTSCGRNTVAAETMRCRGAIVAQDETESDWNGSVIPRPISKSDALPGGPSVRMKVSLRLRFSPVAASDCLLLRKLRDLSMMSERETKLLTWLPRCLGGVAAAKARVDSRASSTTMSRMKYGYS